ncbi:MAG TPA: hypothetical protein VFM91_09025 [Propionibacteriaceae bacterium]|nr:hypothetical protein [Propionibacteriaceae bacterium]
MNVRQIAAAAVVGSLVPVVGLGAASSASAQASSTRISAVVSDSTPASGDQFVVHGRFVLAGTPAEDRPVKVQALRDGTWTQLDGARVTTNDEGRYRVRVVLSQTGKRTLRVVGVSPEGSRNAFHRFVVTVH